MLVLTFLTARLAARISTKYLVGIGTNLSIAGAVLMVHSFSVGMTMTDLIPGLILFGLGLGLALGQLRNLSLSSAKPSETEVGAGLFNTFRNLGMSLGTAIVGTLMLTFCLSGLVLGINGSAVLPQEDKDELTALVTQSAKEMNREEFEDEIEKTLGDYPDEYIEELDVIVDDSGANAMRVVNYAIAGMLGVSLIASLFLSRRKLVPNVDEATGPPT